MKRITAAILVFSLLALPAAATSAESSAALTISAPSAVLMEKETGAVLFEKDAHARYEPASVTKVMTLLLVMEAIEAGQLGWEDMVTASLHAISMGGSQIWLKENEQLSVRDMVKAVAVVSANDCAVALAEHIAGSEEAFVARMNARAAMLGMADTTFLNCTGLPATGHLTSAWDIALMSRELILYHPAIREFTTIWMDTLRNGQFQLSNTNKLIRFYDGATGLKTGFTNSALYCLSATAERDGMELIAAVMHAPTSQERFESAKVLLNWGFANYALLPVYPGEAIAPIPVTLGESDFVQPVPAQSCSVLIKKSQAASLTTEITLCESVEAPVAAGDKLGELRVLVEGTVQDTIDLIAAQPVARKSLGGIFRDLLGRFFLGK